MVDLPLSPEIIRQIDSRALEARKIKKVTIRNQAFTRRKSEKEPKKRGSSTEIGESLAKNSQGFQ